MNVSFELAGVSHRIEAFKGARVDLSDLVTFQPEPTNKFDPDAIMVLKGETQIGYVPKTHTILLKQAVQEHRVTGFVCASWPRGCWINAVIAAPEEKVEGQ